MKVEGKLAWAVKIRGRQCGTNLKSTLVYIDGRYKRQTKNHRKAMSLFLVTIETCHNTVRKLLPALLGARYEGVVSAYSFMALASG
jgi:hypothetical protein